MNLHKLVTKKFVFFSGLLGVALALIIQYLYDESILSRGVFKGIGEPLFFIATALLIVSIFLFLVREEVFRAWLKFAYWWIPLSVVVIYLAKGTSGGGFGVPNVFDQEFVSFIFAALFALISLVLIVIKSLLFRRS